MSRPFGIAWLKDEPNGGRDAARYGKPWTKEERDRLHFLFNGGYTLKGMCNLLERPASGVISKLEQAGLISQTEYGYVREPQTKVPKSNPTETEKEDPMLSKLVQVPVIETRTFIDGRDAESMTDSEIFSRIAQLEDSIKKLEWINNRPKKLLMQIEKHKQEITALVAYVDSRS